MSTAICKAGLATVGAIGISLLVGCSSVTDLTKERVARSETAVRQAQQTIGNSETGALELQRARDTLEQARKAMNDEKDGPLAERLAQQAQLDSELAVAKSQSASARKAADELQASIQTLRREAGLTSPTQQ